MPPFKTDHLVNKSIFDGYILQEQLTLSSRPVGFHHQPLTDSVREPLDSYGSCQPYLNSFTAIQVQ